MRAVHVVASWFAALGVICSLSQQSCGVLPAPVGQLHPSTADCFGSRIWNTTHRPFQVAGGAPAASNPRLHGTLSCHGEAESGDGNGKKLGTGRSAASVYLPMF